MPSQFVGASYATTKCSPAKYFWPAQSFDANQPVNLIPCISYSMANGFMIGSYITVIILY